MWSNLSLLMMQKHFFLLWRHISKTSPSSCPSKKQQTVELKKKIMFLLLEYLNIRVKSTECSGYALGEYWRVSSGIYLSAWDELCEITFSTGEEKHPPLSFVQLHDKSDIIKGLLSVWQWGNGHSTRSTYMSQYFKIKSRHFLHSESFCRFCVRNTVQYNSEQVQSLKPLVSFRKGWDKEN